MSRSSSIAVAVSAEIAAHKAVLDADDCPETITLVVNIGPDGQPHHLIFRSEWQNRPQRRRRPIDKSA